MYPPLVHRTSWFRPEEGYLSTCRNACKQLPSIGCTPGEVREGSKLGIAHRNFNATKAPILEKCAVLGQILMVCLTSDVAYCAPEGAGPFKELLAQKPPESVMTFGKLPAYHSMSDYVRLVRKCIPSR